MQRSAFRSVVVVCLFLAVSFSICLAQDATAAAAPSAANPKLSVDDVIKLSQAGIGEDVIITKIKKNGQPFDLSPDQLLQLKTAKVTDRVIQYMLDPTKTEPAAAAAGGASGSGPSWPDEAGVYWRKTGETVWNELLPEVVNWKTGGVMKGIASYGIVKKDMNGHLQGKTSKTQATTSSEFLIVAPEGVAITEYQLLHLHQNGNNREFRSMTGGVFHASGGATRDLVEIDNKKVAPRRYLVSATKLQKGEYGFLPPGAMASQNAAGSTGKIYAFTVLE